MPDTTPSAPLRARRPHRAHRAPPLLARALLPLFVLAIILVPGLTAGCAPAPAQCSAPDCPGDLPPCGDIPGLETPPAPITPLAPPALPTLAATRAGALPGAGTISPTGEYQYRLPLDVPAGRAGMQPALALVYGSRSKNGHLGAGMQIDGLSEINHCPKTLATEGVTDGVHFDAGDALCLDGHKLVAVAGPLGGDGTEYRTEDDRFARIVSSFGKKETIERFTVWTKEGLIREYSAVWARLPDCKEHSCKGVDWSRYVFAWLLAEERDRAGNAVRYTYEVDSDDYGVTNDNRYHSFGGGPFQTIEYFPTAIDYTYHGAALPLLVAIAAGRYPLPPSIFTISSGNVDEYARI